MPRALTTPDRVVLLLSLVPYLVEHGETPLAELAERFDVAPKVLRGLIEFLGSAGVPGESGTYQHGDLYDIDWEALEQHDLVRLTQVVAVDDTPRFSSVETSALIAGLHALAPMLPESLRETAERATQKLALVQTVEPRPVSISVTADPNDETLTTITEAMDSGRRLAFDYRDAAGNETARTVDPLLLGQSGGAWYLRAYCHDRGGERSFLVDRLRAARVLAERSEPAESRASATNSTATMFSVEGGSVMARLRLRSAALHRIVDFAPRIIGEGEPGWVRAEVELLHAAVAVRLVQAAPGELIVEAPAAAREAVAEWVDRALAQYDA